MSACLTFIQTGYRGDNQWKLKLPVWGGWLFGLRSLTAHLNPGVTSDSPANTLNKQSNSDKMNFQVAQKFKKTKTLLLFLKSQFLNFTLFCCKLIKFKSISITLALGLVTINVYLQLNIVWGLVFPLQMVISIQNITV